MPISPAVHGESPSLQSSLILQRAHQACLHAARLRMEQRRMLNVNDALLAMPRPDFIIGPFTLVILVQRPGSPFNYSPSLRVSPESGVCHPKPKALS